MNSAPQKSPKLQFVELGILKLYYYQKTKIQPCVLPESENPAVQVPVLKLYYYQRTKIQPAAGDGGSYYYKQEEEEKEKREEEEEVIIDTPSFSTVGRISRSNLSLGGYYCDVYIRVPTCSPTNPHTILLIVPPTALRKPPYLCFKCPPRNDLTCSDYTVLSAGSKDYRVHTNISPPRLCDGFVCMHMFWLERKLEAEDNPACLCVSRGHPCREWRP